MPKNDPEQIDEMIARYQGGDSEAAMELLEALGPLIRKHFNMLRGKIDIRDKAQRFFMSLFVGDSKVKFEIRKARYNKSALTKAWNTYDAIVGTMKKYDSEDLLQDIRLEILRLAKRYKKMPGKTFLNYLAISLPYRMVSIVSRVAREPDLYGFGPRLQYSDEYADEDAVNADFDDEMLSSVNDYSQFGPSWISGELCTWPFALLTPLDRSIIALKYYEGLKNSEISKRLGISLSTVRRRLTAARQTLEEAIAESAEGE